VLVYTKPLNQFFLDHLKDRNYMLIFCSGLLDTCTLYSMYRWIRYSPSWRFVMALAMFYVLRGITTNIFQVEMPQGYNWAFPGVFSIFVPYGKTADFFYSGHVGGCMIQYLEFNANG
jgi:hypothetical protein|tara:strand:+ start:393 stop:743 length:351 start_codon:yes stop_codon:yes gene_type:complete